MTRHFTSHYLINPLVGIMPTSMVSIEELGRKEYEIEGHRLRPYKVWKVQPQGKKGFVMGLFKLPEGKVVRKVLAKVDEKGNITPA